MIDTHCHLDFDAFANDRPEVMERARLAGVTAMVTISTRISTQDRVTALVEAYPNVWCTAGVHPHQAEEEAAELSQQSLVSLARHPKIVGIGESGLDYHYDKSPRDVQIESFRTHVRACLETGLPLVVHSREAEDDTIRIIQEESAGQRLAGVLHCFSGSAAFAEAGLELGFHISFSGILTFRKSEALRTIAASVPLDRLLVETDAPYLAPEPMRGKRNEPAHVVLTATCLALVKSVTIDRMAAVTTANAKRLFPRMAALAVD